MASAADKSPQGTPEPTIGRLVSDVTESFSTLVTQQLQLFKSEVKVTVRTSGIGIALLSVAAFLLLIFIILLSITAAFFINWGGKGLDLHWAFGIVTLFYVVLAAVLALIGVKKIKKAKAPERAIRQVQATKSMLTHR